MHISQRTLHIPTSPIRKLAPIANRVEKTKKIYHLNIGQPDIPTPDSFFEGVASYHPKPSCIQSTTGSLSRGSGIIMPAGAWSTTWMTSL